MHATRHTAWLNTIREMAIEHGELDLFRPNENEDDYENKNLVSRAIVKQLQDHAAKTTNRELRMLLPDGIAIHHAGKVPLPSSKSNSMHCEVFLFVYQAWCAVIGMSWSECLKKVGHGRVCKCFSPIFQVKH